MVEIAMGGMEVSASAALEQGYVSSGSRGSETEGNDRPLGCLVEAAFRAFQHCGGESIVELLRIGHGGGHDGVLEV